MVEEGDGKERAFTQKRSETRSNMRLRDDFARALDLKLLLLLHRQHENATRSAAAARILQRKPRFLVAHG
jgi:hypothetical protein